MCLFARRICPILRTADVSSPLIADEGPFDKSSFGDKSYAGAKSIYLAVMRWFNLSYIWRLHFLKIFEMILNFFIRGK